MPSRCQQLKTEYEALKILKDEFASAYAKLAPTDSLAEIKKLKKELENARDAFLEKFRIIVKDAVNPYREALLKGGIADPALTAERKDAVFNIRESFRASIEHFRSQNLPEWADAIEAVRGDIRLTPEKRSHIEAELKDGSIPILMPGKDVQLATYKKALENLKTLWIKDSKEQTLNDTLLWDYYDTLINQKAKELVADVPDRPYILLTKPTQAPPQESCGKTAEEQKEYLKDLQKKAKKTKESTPYAMLPAEYAALQSVFTRRAQAEAGKQQLATLSPLDSQTWTRFIDVPLSPDGMCRARASIRTIAGWSSAGPMPRTAIPGTASAPWRGSKFELINSIFFSF